MNVQKIKPDKIEEYLPKLLEIKFSKLVRCCEPFKVDTTYERVVLLMILNYVANVNFSSKVPTAIRGMQSYHANEEGVQFIVKPSKINPNMLGLFTVEDIPKNQFIGKYNGYIVPRPIFSKVSKYSFGLPDGGLVDPLYNLEPSRENVFMASAFYDNFILYTNEPPKGKVANVYSYGFNSEVHFGTCRKIVAGEELYVHYGPMYLRDYEYGKSCAP